MIYKIKVNTINITINRNAGKKQKYDLFLILVYIVYLDFTNYYSFDNEIWKLMSSLCDKFL